LIVIFGIYGAARGDELVKVVKDIRAEGDVYLVSIPDTKTHKERKFYVDIEYASYVRRYINLCPPNVGNSRFF